MRSTRYHEGGYKPATPAQNRAEEWETTAGYTRWDKAGVVVEQRALTPAESAAFGEADAEQTRATNETTLTDKARSALTANATFLAIASPTNAQNATQIKALTRQVNALIRLVARALDTTDGS